MSRKLITIGIPVYNAERYLERCIWSILNQSYTNFELLIIDDGSTDRSVEVISSFKDERIRLIIGKENKGVVHRANQLIKEAKGEYFARMDADDVMFPDRIKIQLDALLEDSSIDLSHTAAISINAKGNILGFRKGKKITKERLLKGDVPLNPSIMAKTEWFKKYYYQFGYTKMEDLEFWYRSIDDSNYKEIEVPCLFYTENSTPNSMKHLIRVDMIRLLCKQHQLSYLWRLKTNLKDYIKYFFYLFLERIDKEDILLKGRSSRMSDEEKNEYGKRLATLSALDYQNKAESISKIQN